ncbi:anti-sigma B factor RsbW [Bacillus sp. JJ1532]|uniref:anti-sigma B factor RsbW n=1 Tax=unclassified Bacillus (in: firmicutes) TaxID=185979 RepID=UPI002FFFD258
MNQSFDYIEIKVPAKAEFVNVVRLTLSGIASRMGFLFDEIEDLKIAVSEACTNAVQHAYKEEEHGEVVVGFGLYENRLEVMVADNGKSFDFLSARQGIGRYQQTDSIEYLREGGLGLYLIESLMDEVRIHDKEGVTVFMIKYLEGEQVEMDAKALST